MTAYEKLLKCFDCVRSKTDFVPSVAIVLGSGLGGFARNIDVVASVPYSDIEGFPVPTVSGHAGNLVLGYINKIPVAVLQGRVHYYEGYSMQDAVLPVRLAKMLGAKALILTNAAGGINRSFAPGDFMLIRGHITSLVPSPLIGENIGELGTRFPDMSEVYEGALRDEIKAAAAELDIPLKEGVYIQVTGPNYETPEEIAMYGMWGADAVGMSTACEAMAARHAGLRVSAISCITNPAAGIGGKLSHEEVKETADKISGDFEKLIRGAVIRLGNIL